MDLPRISTPFRTLVLASTLLASTALASPAWAQGAPSSTFTETLDVEVVNVEVYVTNRKGEPITGLSAGDFQILEDGKPVQVTNFYAVEGGQVAFEGLAPPSLETTDGGRTELAPLPEDQRLHAVLFIDSLNISPRQRNKVILDLVPFVEEQMQPGDRVMIVSNGPRLEVVQGFTEDRQLLVSKLQELAESSSQGAAVATTERDTILRDIARASLPVGGGAQSQNQDLSIVLSEAQSIFSTIELYAQRHQDQTFRTLETLRQFVDSLAGIPGRKSIVYISEGLSLRPGETLFQAWQGKFAILQDAAREARDNGLQLASGRVIDSLSSVGLTASQFNVTYAFRALGNRASANRVTFYGIRASDSFASISADVAGGDFGALDSPSGGQTYSAALESVDAANRGGGMWELADATGGFAITNASTFRVALDKLRKDFDAFYSLGYTSERPRDEKKHRLEVRVSNRSHQVRYRRTFRDKSHDQRMNDRTLAALVYEAADNPLSIAVDIATARVDDAGNQRVPILVKVPVERLTLIPLEHHYEGRISIHVGARDSEGRTSQIQSMQVPIQIPKDQLSELVRSGRVFGHHFMLEMIPDQHMVVIGVRDEIADVAATTLIEQPYQTAEAGQQGP